MRKRPEPSSAAPAGRASPSSGRGPITAAVAGNPNCGKTALFNFLTGTVQAVANYPGVTVERKVGRLRFGTRDVSIVDLPGTYSLTAYSLDELIARDFVIQSRPHVVLNVVDASNLERNLYLTVQLLEMRLPMVIALNMADVARRRGCTIDVERMSALLGVPVIETVATTGEGIPALVEALVAAADGTTGRSLRPVSYGHEVEGEVEKLADLLGHDAALAARYPVRWLAVKLIEGDEQVLAEVRAAASEPARVEAAVRAAVGAVETHFGESAATIVAERRHGFAAGVVRECVRHSAAGGRDLTEKIDAVVCNRVFGPLLLLGVVYGIFLAIFRVADDWPWLFGRSPTGWVQWFFDDYLTARVAGLRSTMPMLHSLLQDGVIGGVGGVIGFVPLIAVMFLFVAVLEDTGYIARAAFVLDRLLRPFGLQGKSILALIVSGGLGAGGCAVPGVMATRTLREEKDRLVTMLVAPLMNCGAKMPVYLMLIAAFFADREAEAMFLLWAASWVVVLGAAWLLRRLVIRGDQAPFVMELPAYHVPTMRGMLLHTWERCWLYVRKAGTIILAVNIVLWAMMYFPRANPEPFDARRATVAEQVRSGALDAQQADDELHRIANEQMQRQLRDSVAGRLGSFLVPVSRWAGFDWRDNIALIGGFAAKEVVLGTLGVAYSMGTVETDASTGLAQRLAADPGWSPVRAAAMMAFVMVYAPCLSTVAAIRRESGRWRWTLLALAYSTGLAFLLACAIYQVGTLVRSIG